MAYNMIKSDFGPRFLFGKIYSYVVNARGNLELQPLEITDEDRAVMGPEIDKLLGELS